MNVLALDREPMARDRAVACTAVAAFVALLLVEAPWMPAPVRAGAAGVLLALPGYWCSRIVLPVRTIGLVERVAATIALSFATTMIVTLVLDIVGIKLTRPAWVLSVAVVGVAAAWWGGAPAELAGAVARPRRARLPAIVRRPRDLILLAVVLVVLIVTAVLARTPLAPPAGVSGYTQLWLVPNAQGHELGIASFELRGASYHLVLLADDVIVAEWDVSLEPGQRWTTDVPATVGHAAAVLHGRLYKDGTPDPYRAVDVRLSTASPP